MVVGLTGPIGGGKSTVAGLLAERGAEVLDCDRLARQVTEPGRPALADIAARFGSAMIAADGTLDRAALARVVFRDPEELAALERIVHPRVTELVEAALTASPAAVKVVEAIKLIEAGYDSFCDQVWIVTAPAEVRIERLIARRGMAAVAVRERVAAQSDFADKLPLADRVLVNDGDQAALAGAVAEAWATLV